LTDKVKTFEFELSQIKDNSIREFTTKVLEVVPDYFWTVPASSTGRYHPKYALNEGGLIRHTQAAVRIALELFRCEAVQSYNDIEKDIIISALILHDTCKHGLNGSKYTITEHPLVACQFIKNQKEICQLIDKKILNEILEGIETHMGNWVYDYKTKKEVLSKPKRGKQVFIHMADYLASRKCLEFDFDAKISK
jgi:23S rRNA maturation-related 3'-5' exoribonuclease YhaM